MTLCERIKSICDERGLSVYRIEKDCGFGNGSIMKWENSSPKVDNVIKLADYFDVSVDYLLGRENTSLPIHRQKNEVISAEELDALLKTDNGLNYLEKLCATLNKKQQIYVISWLIGYMVREGLPVHDIL